jgi:lysophospholipase L1-like esterase
VRHEARLRAGRLRAPERDFAALARQTFTGSASGAVAFVGDSQVALSPWPELLGHGCRRGVPGAKIADVRSWIGGVLADGPAQLVLVIGSNDVYFGVAPAHSLAAAAHLLDRIDAGSRCPVTIVSVPPVEVAARRVRALNGGLQWLAGEHGFQWLDIVPTLAAMAWTEDGLHLTEAAYGAVLPSLAAALDTAERHTRRI